MKKKLLLILCMASFPMLSHTMSFSGHLYIPTIFKNVSGSKATVARFTNTDDSFRFLIPFEFKLSFLQFDKYALSGNLGFSHYIDGDDYGSFNITAGASLFYDRKVYRNTNMTGWYTSLYPVYELPLIALGNTPLWSWRLAADIGYSFVWDFIQFKIYTRGIVVWNNSNIIFLPDIGFTIGLNTDLINPTEKPQRALR